MRAGFVLLLIVCAVTGAAHAKTVVVAPDDHGQFHTVQAAIDAIPSSGGDIEIMPGTYREKITLAKNNVHIKGMGKDPSATVLVYGDCAVVVGGTFKTPSLSISGDRARLENLTVQNDCWLAPNSPKSQAVALAVTGDEAVITHVRLLGHQDTLYANKGAGGRMSRQYYSDCYIEGHVDFIFGNAKAFFDHCELHGLTHQSVMYTAQSKNAPDEDSAYVFDHCTLTADPEARGITLGRAWRPYATVIFLNTRMDAAVIPEGWREWHPGESDTLKTATYAEYNSSGPGASPATREPYSHQLTEAEAAHWSLSAFFGGDLSWIPAAAQR